jgi:hypothetical protein
MLWYRRARIFSTTSSITSRPTHWRRRARSDGCSRIPSVRNAPVNENRTVADALKGIWYRKR